MEWNGMVRNGMCEQDRKNNFLHVFIALFKKKKSEMIHFYLSWFNYVLTQICFGFAFFWHAFSGSVKRHEFLLLLLQGFMCKGKTDGIPHHFTYDLHVSFHEKKIHQNIHMILSLGCHLLASDTIPYSHFSSFSFFISTFYAT